MNDEYLRYQAWRDMALSILNVYQEINVLVRKTYIRNKAYFETPTTLPGSKRFSLSQTAKNAACGPPYPKKSELFIVCRNIYLSAS